MLYLKKSTKWMKDYDIPLLGLVANSPDLSPIETLWHEMKKLLWRHPVGTIPELKQRLQEIWDCFTLEFCQGLVKTMPRRIVTQW